MTGNGLVNGVGSSGLLWTDSVSPDFFATGLPIANIDALRAMSRYLHDHNSRADIVFLTVVIASLAALWMAVHWYNKVHLAMEQNGRTPRALFNTLCFEHGLSRSEKKLLEQIAGESGEQCRAFVDPQVLGQVATLNSPNAEPAAALSRKLFGSLSGM